MPVDARVVKMNVLLLEVLAIILLFVARGYKKGFFKSTVSAIGIVLAVFLTVLLYPHVDKLLCRYTGMDEAVRSSIEKRFDFGEDAEKMTRAEEMKVIEALDLPENVKTWLIENSNTDTYVRLGIESFSEYLAVYLTDIAMKGISFALTYIVLLVCVYIFVGLSDIASNIPIVRGIDRLGGMVFGAAQAVLIIWAFMIIVTLFSSFEWAGKIMKMIDESSLLLYIYKKNIFLKFVVDILTNI